MYEIKVTKRDAEGSVLATHSIYKSFSYSAEYNIKGTQEDYAKALSNISEAGEGMVLTEARDVFENVVKYLHKTINPRIVFTVITLVAFILDVAVRKFKFKWPHELVQNYLDKKVSKSKA